MRGGVEMAKKLMIDTQRCKSCALCIDQCPKGALSIGGELNKAGYRNIVSDGEKCSVCGLCYSVCPDYVFSIVEE
jgi:2-oxoglutarate ferredoxin oxidoreductase subunit delta